MASLDGAGVSEGSPFSLQGPFSYWKLRGTACPISFANQNKMANMVRCLRDPVGNSNWPYSLHLSLHHLDSPLQAWKKRADSEALEGTRRFRPKRLDRNCHIMPGGVAFVEGKFSLRILLCGDGSGS